MTFLYTLPDCPACKRAKEKLKENFVEVVIDNPLLNLGVQTLLRKPGVAAPLLVRTNGNVAIAYFITKGSDGDLSFVKILR